MVIFYAYASCINGVVACTLIMYYNDVVHITY